MVALLIFWAQASRADERERSSSTNREFSVKGVVKKIDLENGRVVIAHQEIPSFMDAMTMPFRVKDPTALESIHTGDSISFRLSVTAEESWIDHIVKIPDLAAIRTEPADRLPLTATPPASHPLLEYHFTNEFGQPVRLADFRGQVLALTFIFTRCPIPDYCPRLTKNFDEASRKLRDMAGAPSNYHFLSVTFDPEFDTPERLKAYAENFNYDAIHWSFLTGPSNKVAELARQSGVKYERDVSFFNHDLRTLIIDGTGRLRMVFPFGGNLSDAIVQEMIKAAALTNQPAEK